MIPDEELLAELQNDPISMGYWGSEPDGFQPTKQLLQLLGGRRLIDNPEAAEQVAKPITMVDLISLVPSAQRANMTQGTVSRIRELVDAQDTTNIGLVVQWLSDRGAAGKSDDALPADTITALQARLVETWDDPSHPAQVYDPQTPRVAVLWGDNTDAEQVDRVLGRAG